MMAALLTLLLAAPLEVEPGVPCVSAERLAVKVASSGLQVRVRRAAPGLQVSGQRSDGRRWSRDIPLDDDCAAVERAIAVLVSTWSSERALPSVEAPAPSPSGPPTAHHAPIVKAPAPPPNIVTAPVVAVVAEPTPIRLAPAPVAVAVAVSEPIQTGPSVQALVRVGINGRSPPALLPAGELVVQVLWHRIGFSASGGLSGTAMTPLGAGSVTSMAGWASVGAATSLALVPRVRFEAALGARLFIARVRAEGFSTSTASTLVSPAAYAEAGLVFELAGPVILGLWGLASVRPFEEVLRVDGVSGSVLMPRWQFGAMGGVGVRWP